jgi:hypothetical protein
MTYDKEYEIGSKEFGRTHTYLFSRLKEKGDLGIERLNYCYEFLERISVLKKYCLNCIDQSKFNYLYRKNHPDPTVVRGALNALNENHKCYYKSKLDLDAFQELVTSNFALAYGVVA